MAYGRSRGEFEEHKRAVEDEHLGPLVSTEMTRCIHCTRCVRFGEEIAGMPELGVMSRGGRAYIGTYLGKGLHSELSGNVIDVCPVGALTAKPSRFKGRSWTFKQHAQLARHDCVGSHVYCHVQSHYTDAAHTVMRVLPRAQEDLNEVWLSDRDRFSYEALQHQRLTQPQIKEGGQWKVVPWNVALDVITDRLSGIIQTAGADQIAGCIAPSATVEEGFLFQDWLRSLGVRNIDCRMREADVSHDLNVGLGPRLACTLPEIETHDRILLLEAFPRRHQPMLNHRIRKAAQSGAAVLSWGSRLQDANYTIAFNETLPISTWAEHMATLVKALLQLKDDQVYQTLSAALEPLEVTPTIQTLATTLLDHQTPPMILIGETMLQHPDATQIIAWAECLAGLLSTQLSWVTSGANTAGLWLSGCVPHRAPGAVPLPKEDIGLGTLESFKAQLKAYIIHDVMPDLDVMGSRQALEALNQSAFNVYVSPFESSAARDWADVILPCAAGYETSGTLVNATGTWQTVASALAAPGEAKPAWKIYAALAAWHHTETQLKFDEVTAVAQAVEHAVQSAKAQNKHDQAVLVPEAIQVTPPTLWGVAYWHDLREDTLVRAAPALQLQAGEDVAYARCNTLTATTFALNETTYVQVKQGEGQARFKLKIDESIANHTVQIPMTEPVSASLGLCTGPIEVEACA